jgi:hypothetical protein
MGIAGAQQERSAVTQAKCGSLLTTGAIFLAVDAVKF